ncbi:MAG: helical backbone metal receptor [Magnetovibrionaceae bacterium]
MSLPTPAKPRGLRLVSLVPSLTELLFDLGLAEAVVGCTHFCIHPEQGVRAVPSLGGTKKIRLDRLEELRPTHVIVNKDEQPFDLYRKLVAMSERLDFEVVVTDPTGPLDNPDLFRSFGALFDCMAQAEGLIAAFDRSLANLKAAMPAPVGNPERVLYLIWREPWMAVSPDSYIARALSLIGWEVRPNDPVPRYPEVDPTELVAGGLDRILLSSEPYRFTEAHLADLQARFPDQRVQWIDGEMTSWYGSRAIAGLDYLAGLIKSGEGGR